MEDNRPIELEENHEDFEEEEDEDEDEEYEEDFEEDEDEEYEEDFEEDEDEEEDHEEGEDVDSVDDDEEDSANEEIEELIPVEMTSPTVSSSISDGTTLQGALAINDNLLDNSYSCEGKPGNQESNESDGGKESLNRGEIDGLFCPICFEAWTSGGEHQICCLPCGHIYGLSCIKKWLRRSPSSRKCPQCKALCKLRDVRVLYASRLCVADEELHKKVRLLEAECAYLKAQSQPPLPSTSRPTRRCTVEPTQPGPEEEMNIRFLSNQLREMEIRNEERDRFLSNQLREMEIRNEERARALGGYMEIRNEERARALGGYMDDTHQFLGHFYRQAGYVYPHQYPYLTWEQRWPGAGSSGGHEAGSSGAHGDDIQDEPMD